MREIATIKKEITFLYILGSIINLPFTSYYAQKSFFIFLFIIVNVVSITAQQVPPSPTAIIQPHQQNKVIKEPLEKPKTSQDEKLSEQKDKLLWLYVIANIINLALGLFEVCGLAIFGIALCITIIGIPFGIQCFELALLALWPFGKTVILKPDSDGFLIFKLLWIFFIGIWVSLFFVMEGVALCCTIIGIPFGLQRFKIAKVAFLPFGAKIE